MRAQKGNEVRDLLLRFGWKGQKFAPHLFLFHSLTSSVLHYRIIKKITQVKHPP